MKPLSSVLLAASLLAASHCFAEEAQAIRAPALFSPGPCETGIFRSDQAAFVAVTRTDRGFSYTFSDGTVGNPQDAAAIVACGKGAVLVAKTQRWPKVAIAETQTRFESNGVLLAGRLMAPPGADGNTALVVFAQGSETGGAIERVRDPYQMVGRGVSVFVYDKRGTGLSEGDYTQNFPRLADDLVAASREARRLAQGGYGRFGLVGLSQGGWIVPLAAARAQAQFLGIGYGLAVDIAEQDAAQVARQMRSLGYGDAVLARTRQATDITATIARSGRKQGLDALAAFQAQYGKEPWFSRIQGSFTGALLAIPAGELRDKGLPQYDKLDIDWSLDPVKVLSAVHAPQLWAFAEQDRQAPAALTVERLSLLRQQGHDISLYVFPGADHGMWAGDQAADGSRGHTRIAPGFYDLMADWAKGQLGATYGEAYRE